MNRDLIIHRLVALDAQLRRLRRLADNIGDGAELKARLPTLIAESCVSMQRIMSDLSIQEGWQAGPGGPRT